MNGRKFFIRQPCGAFVFVIAAVAMTIGRCDPAIAAPPLVPGPDQAYSFDANSAKVLNGLIEPSSVLLLAFPTPQTAISGSAIGLGQPGDELNAMSGGHTLLGGADSFAILFSIDASSPGSAVPDPVFVNAQTPFNAADQAAKGQAAGDQYMSTTLFTLAGGPIPFAARAVSNNVLVRNNYDEGGTDFSADPTTSASQSSIDPQDNVNSTVTIPTAARAAGTISNLFYSATAGSPSLPLLSAGMQPSGANIFFHPAPGDPGVIPRVFVTAAELGLMSADDIDAMLVVDVDADGLFSPGDIVLFSLTPESPSLGMIPNASPSGASADVFIATQGQAPALFAPASSLGLGDAMDNIDALELLPCADSSMCGSQNGIRLIAADFDDDGDVDIDDKAIFESCFTGPGVAPSAGCEPADLDGDGDVDCDDWQLFKAAWTQPTGPPPLAACPDPPVPALSQWGVAALALVMLTAGTIVLRRRSDARLHKGA